MTKSTAIALMFALLAVTGNGLGKERRGADLFIQKKNGLSVRGELITVKRHSLLLLSPRGADVVVDISDIENIRITKKSKFWVGAGIGFAVGFGGGAVGGFTNGDDPPGESGSYRLIGSGRAFYQATLFGVLGTLLGMGLGEAMSADRTIPLGEKPPSQIAVELEKLSRRARVPSRI